ALRALLSIPIYSIRPPCFYIRATHFKFLNLRQFCDALSRLTIVNFLSETHTSICLFMKIFLSLVFLFIWCNGRTAQAQTIAKFDQTQFEQAEFGRSSLVTDALSKASVIGLGEGTHSMGTIFTAKVKFIKFLHEQMGYHTIAFESGIYDVYKAN